MEACSGAHHWARLFAAYAAVALDGASRAKALCRAHRRHQPHPRARFGAWVFILLHFAEWRRWPRSLDWRRPHQLTEDDTPLDLPFELSECREGGCTARRLGDLAEQARCQLAGQL